MTKAYSDSDFMKIALSELSKCQVHPRVGAVIAEHGILLSTGYRGEVDGFHAERVAIEKLKSRQLKNATLFTTLEPCVEIHEDQIQSCSDLIIESKLPKVVIGVLDPNGSIYSQGYRKLLENKISVAFFNSKLRAAIEEQTFRYGQVELVIGSGKRRIPVVHSGTKLKVQFSHADNRSIEIKFSSLQPAHGCVDLIAAQDAVRVASDVENFSDITEPMVFRFPSHFSRMRKGMISIVKPNDVNFCLLVKLLELHENDIIVEWQVRNER
ncbi:deaminase [Hyphococcus flavus]|uniref:Deaminase n=1 Tax=Hyphococcus flavus TaxID=1866326 RepID=A0AAE9ZDA3_9PROT|nr:deaminase [Hyphococcus flavus]WDI32614.1 deaminase [Hyphococcus flavus]